MTWHRVVDCHQFFGLCVYFFVRVKLKNCVFKIVNKGLKVRLVRDENKCKTLSRRWWINDFVGVDDSAIIQRYALAFS